MKTSKIRIPHRIRDIRSRVTNKEDLFVPKLEKKKDELIMNLAGDVGWDIDLDSVSQSLDTVANYKKVQIRLNSFGGEAWTGVAIYNRLLDVEVPIEVRVLGYAASAASIIAMAGDEISIGETGFIMIHKPWMTAAGNSEDLIAMAAYLDDLTDQMANLYAQRTGNRKTQIKKWMAEEREFHGQDAVDNNFATRMIKNKTKASKIVSMRAWLDKQK